MFSVPLICGYLNRIQSDRRLEQETQCNIKSIWLTGRLMPVFKTIADFGKDNGKRLATCGESSSFYAVT